LIKPVFTTDISVIVW